MYILTFYLNIFVDSIDVPKNIGIVYGSLDARFVVVNKPSGIDTFLKNSVYFYGDFLPFFFFQGIPVYDASSRVVSVKRLLTSYTELYLSLTCFLFI